MNERELEMGVSVVGHLDEGVFVPCTPGCDHSDPLGADRMFMVVGQSANTLTLALVSTGEGKA